MARAKGAQAGPGARGGVESVRESSRAQGRVRSETIMKFSTSRHYNNPLMPTATHSTFDSSTGLKVSAEVRIVARIVSK